MILKKYEYYQDNQRTRQAHGNNRAHANDTYIFLTSKTIKGYGIQKVRILPR